MRAEWQGFANSPLMTPQSISAALSSRPRLEALESYRIVGTGPEAEYDEIARDAAECFAVKCAAVSFLTDDVHWLKARTGGLPQSFPPGETFCAYLIALNRSLVVPDATRDSRFSAMATVKGAPHLRFYAGAPVRAPGGWPIGAVYVVDTQPREVVADDQMRLLVILAERVAARLELRRLAAAQDGLTGYRAPQAGERATPAPGEAARAPGLSPRQLEVLTWAARGKSAPETAAILGVSTRTVRFHLAQACLKLDVTRTATALALAVREGLVTLAAPGSLH